jgi:hypothetical protein
MRILLLFLIGIPFLLLIAPARSFAQPGGHGMYRGMPYGQSCPGPRGGGPYGIRKPVTTADQAKHMVETYFSGLGQEARPGRIEEKNWYFEVEILDRDGTMFDRVIVDKRTGRIRSIY